MTSATALVVCSGHGNGGARSAHSSRDVACPFLPPLRKHVAHLCFVLVAGCAVRSSFAQPWEELLYEDDDDNLTGNSTGNDTSDVMDCFNGTCTATVTGEPSKAPLLCDITELLKNLTGDEDW